MAQRNLLFVWKPESFDTALQQPNLIDLRAELSQRRPLSGSLLIWEVYRNGIEWFLTDLEDKKFYRLNRNSDTEVEVSEEVKNSENLPIPELGEKFYATPQGFIDWLIRFKAMLDEYNLEEILKRNDLSGGNLSFEVVHPNLLTVYNMFQEILSSPTTEWFVGLSDNSVQEKIQMFLDQFLRILGTIRDFNSRSTQTEHTEVLKNAFNLCDEIQQQLQQTVTDLRVKKAEQRRTQLLEQLETGVNTTVADAVEKLKEVTDESQKTREEALQNETTRQKEFAELKNKLEGELAKETVSKHKTIFAKQADEHRRVSQRWLIATGILIVIFGLVFYWLFEALRLGGTEWVGVLQNVFTKGFLLTLIYLVLNRSIKNYTAQKHLEVVNRHRQNALDTFEDFFESAGDNPETRHAVLIAATDAIFDANQSGYLSARAKGSDSANPIQQVVRTAFPGSSSTRSED